jgi:hypothetical protein
MYEPRIERMSAPPTSPQRDPSKRDRTAALLTKKIKRIDTLSGHSQNSPNLMHTDKIYSRAGSGAIKNPDVIQTPGFMGRG